MGKTARAEFISARIEQGRSTKQAAADYKWAAARYDRPSAWHAKRLDGFKFTETRVQVGKVSLAEAKREAAGLRKEGVKLSESLARKPERIFAALKEGTRISDLPKPERPKGAIVDKDEIEQAAAIGGDVIQFDSIAEYEDYMLNDEDLDENDFVEYEEWASSGGGSTGSKKG